MSAKRLILASTSPRRHRLMGRLGIPFEAVDSGLDESQWVLPPRALAEKLALEKAAAVADQFPDELILGSDTCLNLDGEMLGKPVSADDAMRILRHLAGKPHYVITGVALLEPSRGRHLVRSVATEVRMRPADESRLKAYVASGEPLDKAGAYAIQGLGGALVEAVRGCYYNIVGFPLCEVVQLLRLHDVSPMTEGPWCLDEKGQPCPRSRAGGS